MTEISHNTSDPKPFSIRKATTIEKDIIADNVVAMAEEGSNNHLDLSVVREGVQAVFDHPERGFYVVAEKEGEIIGSMLVVYEWSTWKNGTRWWTHDVYVDPDHRRQGVYEKMFEFTKDEKQRTPGLVGISLSVHSDNNRARSAYEKVGMQKTPHVIYTVPDFMHD